MAKYNYSKYEVVKTPAFTKEAAGWISDVGSRTGYLNFEVREVNGNMAFFPIGNTVTVGSHETDKEVFAFGNASTGATTMYSYVGRGSGTSEFNRFLYTNPCINYSRGALVGTVQAEDGTYSTNGRHADGYWYVRGSLVNTAPTTPGAFTQPTGELEIGDSKVFTVGASSDAQGNLAKYIWEASINGGSYTKVGETSGPSLTYTIPTATSLKMRVKAVDSGGLESGYRESAVFTVTKPKYYWSKYNVIQVVDAPEKWKWNLIGPLSVSLQAKEGITYDLVSQNFIELGNSINLTSLPVGGSVYSVAGITGMRYTRSDYSSADRWEVQRSGVTTSDGRGPLVQSGIVAAEGTYPLDGRHTDGFWYVRGSRVNQSIAPPGAFTTPATGATLEPKQAITLAFGASIASAISTYEVQSRYNGGAWQNVGAHTNALTRAFTVTTDKALTTVEFRVRAKNTSGVYSDYVYSEAFVIQHNKIPTITLDTENNKTLYEKDTFVIKGTALEPDVGDVIIVYYRINGGLARGFATKVSDGTSVPFSEQLTFKSGKLYRGETEITGSLADGTPHTLEVWAEDNQGGKSVIETRTFYVVQNRPPSLTIDPIDLASGLIDADKIPVTGETFDLDGNDVVVRYRINNGINVEIHNGPAGEFSFDIPVSKLKDGENAIVVEVSDTYDFKASKTIKLNKSANLTPLASSVMRYTIVPPSGSAQRLSLWIERDETQDVTVEISMTNGTEPENFKRMIWNDEDSRPDPEPAPIAPGIVEDFWKYKADAPAEHIAIKISWTGDKPIFKVTGALMQ